MQPQQCVACQHMYDMENQTEHYQSQWHRYNVKRKVAKMAPLTLEMYEQVMIDLRDDKESKVKKNIQYGCRICKKRFRSEETLMNHLQTKKHKQKIKKEEKKLGRELQKYDYTYESNLDEISENTSQTSVRTESTIPLQSLPANHCLCCPKQFESPGECLDHMTSHGFFIPFIENVVSIEKLLGFLGEVIGEAGQCPYCYKSFSSLEGVWHHMEATGHHQMSLRDEDNPFDEFYDFSPKVEMQENELGELVPVNKEEKRRPVGVNDFNELVLSDGTTIGHRSHIKIYRQAIKVPTTRDAIVLQKLVSKYKALCLPGYGLPLEETLQKEHEEYSKKMFIYRMRHEKRANSKKNDTGFCGGVRSNGKR